MTRRDGDGEADSRPRPGHRRRHRPASPGSVTVPRSMSVTTPRTAARGCQRATSDRKLQPVRDRRRPRTGSEHRRATGVGPEPRNPVAAASGRSPVAARPAPMPRDQGESGPSLAPGSRRQRHPRRGRSPSCDPRQHQVEVLVERPRHRPGERPTLSGVTVMATRRDVASSEGDRTGCPASSCSSLRPGAPAPARPGPSGAPSQLICKRASALDEPDQHGLVEQGAVGDQAHPAATRHRLEDAADQVGSEQRLATAQHDLVAPLPRSSARARAASRVGRSHGGCLRRRR